MFAVHNATMLGTKQPVAVTGLRAVMFSSERRPILASIAYIYDATTFQFLEIPLPSMITLFILN